MAVCFQFHFWEIREFWSGITYIKVLSVHKLILFREVSNKASAKRTLKKISDHCILIKGGCFLKLFYKVEI